MRISSSKPFELSKCLLILRKHFQRSHSRSLLLPSNRRHPAIGRGEAGVSEGKSPSASNTEAFPVPSRAWGPWGRGNPGRIGIALPNGGERFYATGCRIHGILRTKLPQPSAFWFGIDLKTRAAANHRLVVGVVRDPYPAFGGNDFEKTVVALTRQGHHPNSGLCHAEFLQFTGNRAFFGMDNKR
jgi:hypothetical protein